ncbi:MAG TPA: hypothetical protein VFF12_03275 [Myxococcaceae bacterium]|nr:hypothetical protein [Myxococcaceae bacterium]
MPVLRNFLKTLTPPARERPGDWVQHPEYFVGKEALARDDAAAARDAFLRVLAERPDQLDAKAGLARASYLLGDTQSLAQVDDVLTRALSGTTELLRVTLEELGPAGEPRALRPSIAWRVAQRLEADGVGDEARSFYEVAVRSDGLVGLKARVRALELDPKPDARALSVAADLTAREPELNKRVNALLRKFAHEEPRSIELPPEDTRLEFEVHPSLHDETPLAAASLPPPRIVPVRVVGMDEGGLRVSSATGVNPLPFDRVLGIALGTVPAGDGRRTVLTDLVLSWADAEKGATVLRASLGELGLDALYPDVPSKEAYWRMLREIAQRSGARWLPGAAEGVTLPRYASPEEMTRSIYGSA